KTLGFGFSLLDWILLIPSAVETLGVSWNVTCFFLGVGGAQSPHLGGVMYLELMAYIPRARTLGCSGVLCPLTLVPLPLGFILAISAFKAAIFSLE
nr:hypothetical protein [Tanacetum cinerariifolium]